MRDGIGLVFDDTGLMSKSVMSKPSNLELVEKAISAVLGEQFSVKCYSQKEIGDEKPQDDPFKALEELSKKHDVIEII